MIHDSKAEALEARGLYRRAAARWAEVIMLANDDKAREQAAKRRAECIHKAARPPEKLQSVTEAGIFPGFFVPVKSPRWRRTGFWVPVTMSGTNSLSSDLNLHVITRKTHCNNCNNKYYYCV